VRRCRSLDARGMSTPYAAAQEKGEVAVTKFCSTRSRPLIAGFRSIETSGKPCGSRSSRDRTRRRLRAHRSSPPTPPPPPPHPPPPPLPRRGRQSQDPARPARVKVGTGPRRPGHPARAAHSLAAGCDAVALKGEAINSRAPRPLNLIHAIVRPPTLIQAPRTGSRRRKSCAPWDETGFQNARLDVFSKMGMPVFPAGNANLPRRDLRQYPAAPRHHELRSRRPRSCRSLPRLSVVVALLHAVLRSKEAAAMSQPVHPMRNATGRTASAERPPTKLRSLAVSARANGAQASGDSLGARRASTC